MRPVAHGVEMNASALAVLAAYFGFLGLWSWWLGLWPRARPAHPARLATTSLVAALLFVALSLWWRVPRNVQAAVEHQAALPTQQPEVRCEDLDESLPSIRRILGERMTIADSGHIALPREVWENMSLEERNVVRQLAAGIRACRSGAGGSALIRDSRTGAVLGESSPAE